MNPGTHDRLRRVYDGDLTIAEFDRLERVDHEQEIQAANDQQRQRSIESARKRVDDAAAAYRLEWQPNQRTALVTEHRQAVRALRELEQGK